MEPNYTEEPTYTEPTPQRRVNSFLRLLLSVLPGAGHMYLGLLQRGLQLMVLGIGGIAMLVALVDEIGIMYGVVTIFFSIFDCREAHLRMAQGQPVPDVMILDWQGLFGQRWAGWALILLGGMGIYRVLVHRWLSMWIGRNFFIYAQMADEVLLGALAIGAGVWLLRRTKKEG